MFSFLNPCSLPKYVGNAPPYHQFNEKEKNVGKGISKRKLLNEKLKTLNEKFEFVQKVFLHLSLSGGGGIREEQCKLCRKKACTSLRITDSRYSFGRSVIANSTGLPRDPHAISCMYIWYDSCINTVNIFYNALTLNVARSRSRGKWNG